MKKLQFVMRALVVTARDMFTGFILGICAAVLIAGYNPHTRSVAALFIPAGILAGIFKGLSKFVFLNIFSVLPSKGYRYNYPKFKLLLLWAALLLASLVYSYGLKINTWFAGPFGLVKENIVMGGAGQSLWTAVFVFITVTGVISYFYEPPYNEDEFLPLGTDETDTVEEGAGNREADGGAEGGSAADDREAGDHA